jgi:hypothetical protein
MALVVEQLDHLLTYPVQVGTLAHQHLCGDAIAVTDQAEQNVLGPDEVVTERQRLAQRQLEHLLGARCIRDLLGQRLLATPDDLLDLQPDSVQADPE